MEKLKATIDVRDENGDPHYIEETAELIPAGTLSDPYAVEEGLRRLRLDDGRTIRLTEQGFEDLDGNKYFRVNP